MRLPPHVLNQRIEEMPVGPDHVAVWHLCETSAHMRCASEVGKLATVTLDAPEIPDERPLGMFLMRLHPLADQLQVDGDTTSVWLPSATSFVHSTVWHEPKPKV